MLPYSGGMEFEKHISDGKTRCGWVTDWQGYVDYHDHEWGAPTHDEREHFELLVLEGAQAGLSWETVLKKRPGYRAAFDNFDVEKVARYDENKIQELLKNPNIIRNQLKIRSAINNAQCFIKVQEEFGSFDKYIWGFVDGMPIVNEWPSLKDVPANTPLSDQISKDMKKRGFNFVGTTIIYAHIQSLGLVNDHTTDCFRWQECQKLK